MTVLTQVEANSGFEAGCRRTISTFKPNQEGQGGQDGQGGQRFSDLPPDFFDFSVQIRADLMVGWHASLLLCSRKKQSGAQYRRSGRWASKTPPITRHYSSFRNRTTASWALSKTDSVTVTFCPACNSFSFAPSTRAFFTSVNVLSTSPPSSFKDTVTVLLPTSTAVSRPNRVVPMTRISS